MDVRKEEKIMMVWGFIITFSLAIITGIIGIRMLCGDIPTYQKNEVVPKGNYIVNLELKHNGDLYELRYYEEEYQIYAFKNNNLLGKSNENGTKANVMQLNYEVAEPQNYNLEDFKDKEIEHIYNISNTKIASYIAYLLQNKYEILCEIKTPEIVDLYLKTPQNTYERYIQMQDTLIKADIEEIEINVYEYLKLEEEKTNEEIENKEENETPILENTTTTEDTQNNN